MLRKYHWLRDLPDQRDYNVFTTPQFKLIPKVELPVSIDLRRWCSNIEDQGRLGSCTGQAIVGAVEYLQNRFGLGKVKGQFIDLSRLFVYYNERVLENSVAVDAGAYIRDGIKALKIWGVCKEAIWPYRIRWFARHPSAKAYRNASSRKISVYARVNQPINDIKQVLASGYPIVFGFAVYESFDSPVVESTGLVPMPKAGEHLLGGHAVLCVGYNDSSNRILVRNSWGKNWGVGGYFTMPYDYISSPSLTADLWTISK